MDSAGGAEAPKAPPLNPPLFFITSLWEQMTPDHGQFGPKGHDWQELCMGQLYIAKYKIYGSHGFRDGLIKVFPHNKSMEAYDPWGMAKWTQGTCWQDLCMGLLDIA